MLTEERQKRIVRASWLGTIVNLLIAAAKIVVGLTASSMAIISEGMNNATDAGSSFLSLVGTKLSSRHPDKKHPFGYGRFEYLTGLTISILMLYTGLTLLISSAKRIFHPEAMSVSTMAIALVAGSAVIKFILSIYVIREARNTESSSLMAVGIEGRNDSFFSIITIAASVLYLTTGINIDAYVGVLFAGVIIKVGAETMRETVSELIGRSGKAELAEELYRVIRSDEMVLNAADMMLHNYGPDRWSGSVNIEIDHKKDIGEIYEHIHKLQLRIMHEYRVTMVFGLYAVDNESPESCKLRACIAEFVRKKEHLVSYHALYKSSESGRIYIDFVVDYKLDDWENLRQEFTQYMKERYPENTVDLTIETEYV